jgi:hypothetical protein
MYNICMYVLSGTYKLASTEVYVQLCKENYAEYYFRIQ